MSWSGSGRRSRSRGCCSCWATRRTPRRGSPQPSTSGQPTTWCPPSPTRCGGRCPGRSTRACCPATSPSRRARRCCAAACWRARSSPAHHGLPLPLEIQHDEFTVDIPENQILRTACERMLLVPRVDVGVHSGCCGACSATSPTSAPIRRGDPVPAWQPTRINARYHAALRLAELVLRATSVGARAGSRGGQWVPARHAPAVRGLRHGGAARGARGPHGGRVVGAVTRTTWTRRAASVLKPDIVWHVGGKVAAVVDAKYKAEKPSGFPNADLYQLLAYCTVLGFASATWSTRTATRSRPATSSAKRARRSCATP